MAASRNDQTPIAGVEDDDPWDVEADGFFALIPERLLYDTDLSPMDIRVYGSLRRFADKGSGKCHPSHATIAKLVGTTARTVRRSTAALSAAGWLSSRRRFDEGTGSFTSNVYKVHNSPVLRLVGDSADTPPAATSVLSPRTPVADKPESVNQSQKTLPLGVEREPRQTKREILEAEFDEWWSGVWNKEARTGAMKHYLRIRSKGLASREHMFLQRDAYMKLMRSRGTGERFWKTPRNWLGEGFWEDDNESKLEEAEAEKRREAAQKFSGPEMRIG